MLPKLTHVSGDDGGSDDGGDGGGVEEGDDLAWPKLTHNLLRQCKLHRYYSKIATICYQN